jgi:Domain of unknown function (DUF3536)
VILDRSPENLATFFNQQATHALDQTEQVSALKLLEIQRQVMLMYTSCGWFFDELSGIETVQVMQYAGRAIHLARDLGNDLEAEFAERLALAKSNLPDQGDGRTIYEKSVKSALVSPAKLAGHYAISSLFESYGERTNIFCYHVEREDYSLEVDGKQRLAIGRARFSSEVTRESARLSFGVLHLGDHNVTGGVRHFEETERYEQLKGKLSAAFQKADTAEAIRVLTSEFPGSAFSLPSLFRDEQRKIVELILNDSLLSAAAAYRSIYENNASLIRFLNGLGIPVPEAFRAAAEVGLNNQIKQVLERPELDVDAFQSYLKEAASSHVTLDSAGLEYAMQRRLEREATEFANEPTKLALIQKFRSLLEFVSSLPFPVAIWEVQNTAYGPLTKTIRELRSKTENNGPSAAAVLNELGALREQLRIRAD